MKTLYDQLGVTPQASAKAIQQSFYRLVKKFDPNQPANQGKAGVREHYLAVREAYRTLSDPEARRSYDHSLQMHSLAQRAKTARAIAISLRR